VVAHKITKIMEKYGVCKARGNGLNRGRPYKIPEKMHSGNVVLIKEIRYRIAMKNKKGL
jgi:hypothetical protein